MLPSWTEIWLWWTGFSIGCHRKKNDSSTLFETCNNILSLSDQLRLWTSKFTVRDGNEFIDVSSAAHGESSTIPLGSTWQHFPYTATMYQFDPSLFHIPDQEFNIDDAEAKLFLWWNLIIPLMDVNWFDTELIQLSPAIVKGLGPLSAPTEKWWET